MTEKRDWNQIISKLTGWLVGFLALASFVLSYEALWTLAIDSEVTWWLAWLWPLTLDFFVLVASLSILRNSLNGHSRLYAWTLVVVFTALSIVFNAIHKGLPIEVYNIYALPYVPMVVYILPPVAFVFSLHLLVQVGDILKWAVQKVDVGSLQDELSWQQERVKELEAEKAEMQEIFDTGNAESKQVQKQLTTLKGDLEEVKVKLQSSEDNQKRLKDRLKAAEERAAITEGLAKFTGLLSDKAEDRVHTARALWPDNSQAFISKAANVSESFTSQVLKANGNGGN